MTLGCSVNSGVAVDHAQALDQPDDLVERAEVGCTVARIARPVCRAAA